MESGTRVAPTSKVLVVIGWLVTAIPLLMMGGLAVVMLLTKPEEIERGLDHLGYPSSVGRTLVMVEIACALLYAIPQTAVLGAILLTGYLGGATASHIRAGEPWSAWCFPVVFGVLVWLGLFLRDGRVRALLPWRRLPG